MSIDCTQLREYIIKPALMSFGLCCDSAVNLLLGTAAQETKLGQYLFQQDVTPGNGGLGIYQMQGITYVYIWNKQVALSPSMASRIKIYMGYAERPSSSRMGGDLYLATIMARLFYYNVEQPLPAANDIPGMAKYYKTYWNTIDGKATEEEFIQNYQEFVK